MADITSTEVVGIGIVAVTFGSFLFKMWTQQNKLSEKITDAFVKNAQTHQQLSSTISSFDKTLQENTLMIIQLYITTDSKDWIYFNSAYGEDQVQLEFLEIDSEVKIHGWGNYSDVRTHEIFALNIPLSYLEKMSARDWKIKAYGKRGDKVFTIPQKMTQPFFEYIKTHILSSNEQLNEK